MKKTIINLLLILVIIYGGFYFIFNLTEIFSIFQRPKESEFYHFINPNEEHWQFRSITNYTIWNLAYCVFYIAYIAIALFALNTKKKIWLVLYSVFTIIIILFSIRFYNLFKASGYDHYPGFDPFLL